MPGISCVLGSNIDRTALQNAMNDLTGDGYSSASELYVDGNCAVVISGHPGYPFQKLETESYFAVMEGMIYNRSQAEVDKLIDGIAGSYVTGNIPEDKIHSFLRECSGEYIVLIYDKTAHEIILFNDRLGRLPFFHSTFDTGMCLSREFKFLYHFMPQITFDRTGMAHFLFLEHHLGTTTVIEEVKRADPAVMFVVQPPSQNGANPAVKITPTLPLNFDMTSPEPDEDASLKKVVELYLESIRNRCDTLLSHGYELISDVSGGFDTRSLVTGYEHLNYPVRYFTHVLITGDERSAVDPLAKSFGIHIEPIKSSHEMDFKEIDRLVYITDCTFNGWSTLVCWRDSAVKKAQTSDKTASSMGLGGEFIRHPFRPPLFNSSMSDMVNSETIQCSLDMGWSSFLAGLSKKDFKKSLQEYFSTYPEKTFTGEVKRFYYEFHYQHTVGEDRNRHMFWTLLPFMDQDYLTYVFSSIPLPRATYWFHTRFLGEIDPRSLNAPIYGRDIDLHSESSIKKYDQNTQRRTTLRTLMQRTGLHKQYKNMKRKKMRQAPEYQEVTTEIERVYREEPRVGEVLPWNDASYFIERAQTWYQLYRIYTLLIYYRQLLYRFPGKVSVG